MVFLLGEGIMDVPTIICVVGQTCSGKDTFAKLLHDKFGYNIICSYTTRPKRDSETEGVEHKFITEDEYEEKYKDANKLAYTEINGYKYFVLYKDIINGSFIYVIDPKGYYELVKNYGDMFNIKLIYLYADIKTRKARYNVREQNTSIPFEDREKAEIQEFSKFEDRLYINRIINNKIHEDYHINCDMIINTTNLNFKHLL